MALVDFESLKNIEVITQDALILGKVQDVRFESLTWTIQGLKIKSNSEISKMINVGSGRSMLMLGTGNYSIRDVVLLPEDINNARFRITADNNDFMELSSLLGKQVMTSEKVLIGVVDSIQVDLEDWTVESIKVKLDKTAYKPLDIKKGLILSKIVSGIQASDIGDISSEVVLNINLDAVKGKIAVD